MAIIKHLCSMAMVSLVVLVIQNSLLVVMTRFSRKRIDAEHNYHTSTLVLNQECVKMLMCLVIYACDDVRKQYERDSSTSASSVAIEVVGGEAALGNEEVASPTGALRTTKDATLSPLDGSLAPPLKESAEADAVVMSEEEAAAATGPSAVLRRAVRVAVPSPPPHGSPSRSDEFPAYSRKTHLRLAWLRAQGAAHLYWAMLRTAVLKRDTLKLFVPAFLFNMQNFLIFVGLSNLDAVSFQVWSQTKLLSTALFSVWLLHRRLSFLQWMSLVALTAGVLGAQLGASKAPHASVVIDTAAMTTSTRLPRLPRVLGFDALTSAPRGVNALSDTLPTFEPDGDEEPQANALIGIAACVLSGLSSSYAGVYFEKVVKTTSPTLSIRNIQLSIFGIPLAFLSMLLLDVMPCWYAQRQCGNAVHWNIFANPFTKGDDAAYGEDGACPVRPFYFWQQYNSWLTWGLVGIHAFGGLLVAIVVKYADNILKGFATGVAVIVSGMMSSVIWGYKPSVAFVLGAVLVIGSSIAFHKFEPKR